ncbi:MAG: hypothetical protein ACI9VN_002659 [Patescibacteria group bacterium]|jgi:hypothetical protein
MRFSTTVGFFSTFFLIFLGNCYGATKTLCFPLFRGAISVTIINNTLSNQ